MGVLVTSLIWSPDHLTLLPTYRFLNGFQTSAPPLVPDNPGNRKSQLQLLSRARTRALSKEFQQGRGTSPKELCCLFVMQQQSSCNSLVSLNLYWMFQMSWERMMCIYHDFRPERHLQAASFPATCTIPSVAHFLWWKFRFYIYIYNALSCSVSDIRETGQDRNNFIELQNRTKQQDPDYQPWK